MSNRLHCFSIGTRRRRRWCTSAGLAALFVCLALATQLSASTCRAQEISSTDNAAAAQTLGPSSEPPQQQQQQEPIPSNEPVVAQQQDNGQSQQQQQAIGDQNAGDLQQQVVTTFKSTDLQTDTQTTPPSSQQQQQATENPSVQAEVGTYATPTVAGESQTTQQQPQVEQQQVEQRPLTVGQLARDAPLGIVMRENVVEQSQSIEQQSGQVAAVAAGAPAARANKPGRLGKRVFAGHVGVFGRKRPQNEQQHQQQQGGPSEPAPAKKRGHHHYYYNTINSKQPQQQQESPTQRRIASAVRAGQQSRLKESDFPEDYREILVQPDQLAPGQEYEVQRQQQQQQQLVSIDANQKQLEEQQRQETRTPQVEEQQVKVNEAELVGTNEAEQVTQANIEQQPQQQIEQQNENQQQQQQSTDHQGFDHTDETSTVASASTPYIRLSSVATINSTSGTNATAGYGQSSAPPGGSEMKLMRIYVIDLDQKLVVGSGGAGPSYPAGASAEQASSQAPAIEQQHQHLEQTKISPDSNDEQQQQTATVYATTATVPPPVQSYEEPASHQQPQPQQQTQNYSPVDPNPALYSAPTGYNGSQSGYAESPASAASPTGHEQQHQRQVLVLPRVSGNHNAKQGDEFILLDRESLHANLSQIMAQMGHYQPTAGLVSSYASTSGYPANHQPQNHTNQAATSSTYHSSPAPPAAHYNAQAAVHYAPGNFTYEMVVVAPASNRTASSSSSYANNTIRDHHEQQQPQNHQPQQQQQAYLGEQLAAKSARAAAEGEQSAPGSHNNWTLAASSGEQQAGDYAAHKQSVAYPALVQHPERARQQQHAQFAAAYPAPVMSVPQYIAPQYIAANATAGWTQQAAAAAANYSSEQTAGEWPQLASAGQYLAAPAEQANYSALLSAPFYSAGPGHEHGQSSQVARQVDKYQPQPALAQHLFAHVGQQQQQQPGELNANLLMYQQQHPIGPNNYGEPGQAPVRAAADSHWRPVDLASPLVNSYGSAGPVQQQQQRPPLAINGQRPQQPDHDVVSLNALQQNNYFQASNYTAQANGTGQGLGSTHLLAPTAGHLIAADGEHAQLGYQPQQQQQQAQPLVGYANMAPGGEHPGASNYENGSLGLAQVGAASTSELAPSQQVHFLHQQHHHPSSSSAGSYPGAAQYNGTAPTATTAQISTTDYHQHPATSASGGGVGNAPLGVTNEYGLLAADQLHQTHQPQLQVSYTSKRYPAKAAHADQSSSAASSSSSEEAPKIPQSYSSMAPAGAGNYRRPSYAASGGNYSSGALHSSVAPLSEPSSEEQEGATEGGADSDADSDQGYESPGELADLQAHAVKPYRPSTANKQVSPSNYKRPANKHKTSRPQSTTKVPYGDSEAAPYQQQADGAAAGEHQLDGATGYQARPAPQGIRQYLSGGGIDSLLQQNQQYAQLVGPAMQHRPLNHHAYHYRYPPAANAPTMGKSLLSWETLSSVASGAAKRLPTALSSFLSPFGMGQAAAKNPPLYPTVQSLGFHNQLGQHLQQQQQYVKSAHYTGDVANFHRPYPFRHMSAPSGYSDGPYQPPALSHQAQQAGEPESELADEYGEDMSSSSSSDSQGPEGHAANATSSVSVGAHEPTGDPAEIVADLATIKVDGSGKSISGKPKLVPSAASKTKGKRPTATKPAISNGDTQTAGKQLEPAQAAVLSSIEQELEQQQQHKPSAGKQQRRRPKKNRPTTATTGEPTASTYMDPSALLSASEQSGPTGSAHQQPITLESLPLDQQRALLAKASQMSGLANAGKQVPLPTAAAGLMYAPDGSPMGAHRPPGLNSVQIGQFKITPQTQFVQSIIEPSRQMLGQYFKQYIGQLGQLAG